jgi:hypothetical protein
MQQRYICFYFAALILVGAVVSSCNSKSAEDSVRFGAGRQRERREGGAVTRFIHPLAAVVNAKGGSAFPRSAWRSR